jgi:hypothetical protein
MVSNMDLRKDLQFDNEKNGGKAHAQTGGGQ